MFYPSSTELKHYTLPITLIKMLKWSAGLLLRKMFFTHDGLSMCFLSLEDETAMYETVVFPDVYEKYYKLLFDQIPLLVYGCVTNDNGAISLEVQRIEKLRKKSAEKAHSLKYAYEM